MSAFPAGPTDAILRQLQDSRAEVVIVDIPAQDAQRAIRTIELIRATTQQIAIFANGEMTQPANIVASMRAGAGEYLDHSAGSEALLEALTRFSSVSHAHVRAARARPGSSLFSAPKAAQAAPRLPSILRWRCSSRMAMWFSSILRPSAMPRFISICGRNSACSMRCRTFTAWMSLCSMA